MGGVELGGGGFRKGWNMSGRGRSCVGTGN